MAIQKLLVDAVGSHRGVEAADRLCRACTNLLKVDEVAISLIFDRVSTGSFGVSSPLARMYNEVQFTLGEGPCLDAVSYRSLVAVPDLARAVRWPVYAPTMLSHDIHSVYAIPIVVAGEYVGTLELFRRHAGSMPRGAMVAALMATELAEIPFLDLLGEDLQAVSNDPDSDLWAELGALTRVEVSQATGMLVAQLDIGPVEAMARLRAHAYATDRGATDVARDILDHRLRLEKDQ